MKRNPLHSALRKLRREIGGRGWVGYLTPVEIVALNDNGYIDSKDHQVIAARRDKATGDSRPSWFYVRHQQGKKYFNPDEEV